MTKMQMTKMQVDRLLECVFPSCIYCMSCGSIIDQSREYALCDQCLQMFRWVKGRTCEKCGKMLQDNYLHELCTDCRENEHLFTKGYACVQYGLLERGLLLSFKYGGKSYAGRALAGIMADRIKPERLDIDLILAVPMHKKKRRQRGYNQAELMALHLARKLAVSYAPRLLIRTVMTPAMSRLRPEERRRNMEGAFSIEKGKREQIQGRKLLLVDDIFTTGSTLDACSNVLLDAGAKEVRFISFAIGANRIKSEIE